MIKERWSEICKKKWIDPNDIESVVKELKNEGKRVVTINGSFDLVHAGHLHILFEAAKHGDVLIVALNTDASIRRYKNEKRPIVGLKQRLEMLSALDFVDFVTWFDELDPRAILKKIQPHVHVNGAEYSEECIEAQVVRENGGTVVLVERVLEPGYATSEIIQKIHSICD